MKRGDVISLNLPQPPGGSGHEQMGSRPAILLAVEDQPVFNLITVIPLTHVLQAKRFLYTLKIEPSMKNGLDVPSIALIFQITSSDRKRVEGLLGSLEQNVMDQVDSVLKRFLNL